MEIDLDKSLRSVMRTGKVLVGTKQAIKASKRGVAKLVIVASNCPTEVKKQIADSKVPDVRIPGSKRRPRAVMRQAVHRLGTDCARARRFGHHGVSQRCKECLMSHLPRRRCRYIALFETLTGAHAKDCLVLEGEDSRIVFVVKSGDMGLAIGKNGNNINRVKKQIGRHVEVIEYSDDPKEFIKNLFQPAMVKNIAISTKGDKTSRSWTSRPRTKASR